MITIEDLKEQLKAYEDQLEVAKSQVYRLDGITQLLRHLINEAEKPTEVKD